MWVHVGQKSKLAYRSPRPPTPLVHQKMSNSKTHMCIPQKGLALKRRKNRYSIFFPISLHRRAMPTHLRNIWTFKKHNPNEQKKNLASYFLSLIRLIKDNKFPKDNIAMLLFLETVRQYIQDVVPWYNTDILKERVSFVSWYVSILHGWTKKTKHRPRNRRRVLKGDE